MYRELEDMQINEYNDNYPGHYKNHTENQTYPFVLLISAHALIINSK